MYLKVYYEEKKRKYTTCLASLLCCVYAALTNSNLWSNNFKWKLCVLVTFKHIKKASSQLTYFTFLFQDITGNEISDMYSMSSLLPLMYTHARDLIFVLTLILHCSHAGVAVPTPERPCLSFRTSLTSLHHMPLWACHSSSENTIEKKKRFKKKRGRKRKKSKGGNVLWNGGVCHSKKVEAEQGRGMWLWVSESSRGKIYAHTSKSKCSLSIFLTCQSHALHCTAHYCSFSCSSLRGNKKLKDVKLRSDLINM